MSKDTKHSVYSTIDAVFHTDSILYCENGIKFVEDFTDDNKKAYFIPYSSILYIESKVESKVAKK